MLRLPSLQPALIAVTIAIYVLPRAAVGGANDAERKSCFDAKVEALVTAEIPSVIPETNDDTIIMRWPWFFDLKIRQVLQGSAPSGTVTALSLQHTYIDPARKSIWWLRRNSAGGFNTLDFPEDAELSLCPTGTPPMASYIRPDKGHTLEESRRDGERRYGRYP
ncbi:hypothetical protein FHS83_002760 [Rhizomicrobium palustre]|uniref:Uncharacterized protein n=1 Tax=Rhizomicrobium palustre TaxID=189966 RepID=A0A846N2J2_9PROT|nr:hypothetical protein [Rhizomicrobium palustre]NIK89442.1 hypothetical protein [Rhizomicrobium palustre]